MSDHTSVEKLIEGISAQTLRDEIAVLKAEQSETAAKIRRRELLLAWKEDADTPTGLSVADDPPSDTTAPQTDVPAPRGRNGKKLRGAAAIRHVLALETRETWNPAEMREALAKHGVETNAHSVQVAMSRMYRAGEFTKPEDGTYVPKTSEGTSDSPSTFFSGGGDGHS